jgi:hypothetical protein
LPPAGAVVRSRPGTLNEEEIDLPTRDEDTSEGLNRQPSNRSTRLRAIVACRPVGLLVWRRVASMIDYSAWPERRLSVRTLFLDPLNPRIPPGTTSPSQRQLIEELVAHDDVYGLGRRISLDGFDPLESLIGVDEDEKTIILEGNRRLAALKLLDSACEYAIRHRWTVDGQCIFFVDGEGVGAAGSRGVE